MKAMLYNNISTCYFHMGNIDKSELNNEMALIEEPDYAKALLRKCMILERKGEYSQAVSIAEFAITRFDDEYEDERNRKIVPEFKEVVSRLSGRVDLARKMKKHANKADVAK
jgi:tetratricopeptide (TPR) repeat protein